MTYDKEFEEWELRHIGVCTSIDFDAMYAAWQAARKDHYRIGEKVEAQQIGAQRKEGTVMAVVYNEYYIEEPERVRRIPAKSRIDEIAEEAFFSMCDTTRTDDDVIDIIKSAILQASKEWEARDDRN